MKQNRIWLSPPHMGGQEINFIDEAFAANWIAPIGHNVDVFEDLICERLGVGWSVALSSGTAALHLSLIAVGVKKNDIVLCQDMTFAASGFSINYVGAEPVFIDSEKFTWNMDPDLLRETINFYISKKKNIGAIVVVHLYGMPAKMDEIMSIANEFNIPVIEDAAESLGSVYKEKQTGSMGAVGIVSFNGNKIITTSGGGALYSNNRDLVYHARLLSSQAREPFIHYEHEQVGFNYRMSNILAGIGRGQMAVLDERVKSRRANFEKYVKFFKKWNAKGFDIEFQNEPDGSFSNRWLTCILIDPKKNNYMSGHTVLLALENDNIEARPTWKPLHMQPVYSGSTFKGTGVSEKLFANGICLPSGSNLSKNDFERIFETLDALFNKYL